MSDFASVTFAVEDARAATVEFSVSLGFKGYLYLGEETYQFIPLTPCCGAFPLGTPRAEGYLCSNCRKALSSAVRDTRFFGEVPPVLDLWCSTSANPLTLTVVTAALELRFEELFRKWRRAHSKGSQPELSTLKRLMQEASGELVTGV